MTQANEASRRAAPLRGWALAWRIVLALTATAAMLISPIDIGTSWIFLLCGLVFLYRIPRTVRLLRARDAVSALPWLLLGAGLAIAVTNQVISRDQARQRFEALVADVKGAPCNARALLPPGRPGPGEGTTRHELRAGLLSYPLLVRWEAKQAVLSLSLHLDIDEAHTRQVLAPNCAF